jgi:hypothetical protein
MQRIEEYEQAKLQGLAFTALASLDWPESRILGLQGNFGAELRKSLEHGGAGTSFPLSSQLFLALDQKRGID